MPPSRHTSRYTSSYVLDAIILLPSHLVALHVHSNGHVRKNSSPMASNKLNTERQLSKLGCALHHNRVYNSRGVNERLEKVFHTSNVIPTNRLSFIKIRCSRNYYLTHKQLCFVTAILHRVRNLYRVHLLSKTFHSASYRRTL